MIEREKIYLTPNGSTVIEKDDVLNILSDKEDNLNKVYECLLMELPLKEMN